MNDKLRRLMRRVALGLPFAVPVLTAPFNVGGCYPIGYQCPVVPESTVVAYASDGSAEVDCVAACGEGPSCAVVDAEHVECIRMVRDCPPAGRRPAGALAASSAVAGHDARLEWLRTAAALEAASVPAFDHLARELRAHGAPSRLVAAAETAREDEVRHATTMVELLAARGGPRRVTVRVGPAPLRSLSALAEDNTREGCVREAWGALEAGVQGERAADADLRVAMRSIARDEARHALLSFEIDAWARARLDASARRRLDASAEEARGGLAAHLVTREAPAGLGLLEREPALRAFARLFA